MYAGWTAFTLLLIILSWSVWTYNRMVRQRNTLKEAWSGIDVQLRRRHDLIPSLIACVEGYRDHERSTLEKVTSARAAAQTVHEPGAAGPAENEVSSGLRQLLAVVENYPQLKADGNFLKLGEQLAQIEDQIQFARRYYNGVARDLNILVESVPCNVIARLGGFTTATFFECESAIERAAPKVAV